MPKPQHNAYGRGHTNRFGSNLVLDSIFFFFDRSYSLYFSIGSDPKFSACLRAD